MFALFLCLYFKTLLHESINKTTSEEVNAKSCLLPLSFVYFLQYHFNLVTWNGEGE